MGGKGNRQHNRRLYGVFLFKSKMNIKDKIDNILFKIGQEIKIHKINSDNTIIEIDYDRYSDEILKIFEEYKDV